MGKDIYSIIKSVYGPKGFNLTDSEFADDMKDSGNRERLYKNLSKEAEGFDMSYAEYEAALGYGDNKPAAELRGTRTFEPAAEPQGTGAEPWKKMVINDNDDDNDNDNGETRHATEETRHATEETRHATEETRHATEETRHATSLRGAESGFREVRKAKGADKYNDNDDDNDNGNNNNETRRGTEETRRATEETRRATSLRKDEIEAREANAGWPSAQSGNDGLRSAEENFERLKEIVGIWNEKGTKFEHGDELLRLYGMFYDKGGKSKIEGRKNAHESLVRLTARLRDERVNRLLGGEIFKTNMTEVEGDELGMMREKVDEMKENERKKMEAELETKIKRLGERRSTEVNPVTGRVTYDAAGGAYATERNNLRVEGMKKIDEEIAAKYGKLDERLNKEIYRRERQYAEWNLKESRKKREEIMGVINDNNNDNDNDNRETRRATEETRHATGETRHGTSLRLSENAKMNMSHAAAFDKDAKDYLGQQNRWEAEGNNWMQSVGQHLGAGVTAFFDKDNVPIYGTVSQYERLAAVYEVAKKLNDEGEGNLTSDEKALLDSYNNYIMVTSGSVGNNRSSAVRTGEMMGESANFMAQMLMFQGVVKTLGKGATLGAEKVAQRLLNYAARNGSNRLAKGVLKATEKGMRGFAKGIGKMYGEYDVQVGGKNIVMSEFKNPLADFAAKEAGATLQTIVTPQMYLDLAEKRAQVMASEGRDLTRSEVMESMYNSWNEISSEASFNRLNNWLLNKAYKGVSPLMPKFVKDAIDTRKYLRTGMNVFHGMPEEFMEEELGAGRSWLVGKLAGWDETVKQSEDFFTKEGQLDMLASFALPTMVGGGMQMGLAVRSKHQYERSRAALLNGMRGMGMSDADIDGMVGFMEQSKDLDTFESRANTLHAAIMTKKMEGGMDFEKAAEETDRLMGDYVRGFMTYNENLNTTMEQWEKMSDEEKEKARVLYGGLADDIAHSRYEAGVMAEVERKYNLGAGGLANIFEQRKAGYALTEEEEKAANEYAHRMLIEAEVREQLQPKMEEIDQRTNKNGMLVSGVVDGRTCYIKESNGDTSVVMFEDGSTKQVKSDKISNVSEQDATQMKRDMEQEMFEVMPKMDEFRPGRMVRMKNGKVGVVLQQSDEGIVAGRQEGGKIEQEAMTWKELDGKNVLGVLPGNVYGDFVVDSVEVNPESGERTVWFRTYEPAAEPQGTGDEAVSMNEADFVEMLDKSGVDMSNAKYEGELTEEEQAERAAKERIEEEKAIRKEVAEMSKRFGVVVNIVTDERDIPNRRVRRALSEGKKVQGWYDVNTKGVYLFLPNIESVRRAKEVVFHELVGHKGIRELVGEERYAQICQRVWRGMSEEDKERFMGYVRGNNNDNDNDNDNHGKVERTEAELENMAADEYMAWVAEGVGSNEVIGEEAKGFEERLVKIWEIIKSFLDELFGGESALTRGEVVQMIELSAMRMEAEAEETRRAMEETRRANETRRATSLRGSVADERAARQAAIEENEYIISADEADTWVEAERERLYDVTRRGANEAMDEQLAREAEAEAARREADEREDRQTGDKAERAFAASDKKRKAEEESRREADAAMNEDMRTLEERVSDELAEAEAAGAEDYTQNKQKSLREGLKKARKQLEEAQEKIKGLGDIKAIRKKKAEIEAKREKIASMEEELAAWENKEREVRPSGKTVAEEDAEIKEFVSKYGVGKSQEWKETVGDAVRAGSVAALEKLRESGAANAVEVASELLNEVGRAKGLLVNDRGTNGEKVRGKKGRGFKTMIGTRYADVKGAFAMFRDTEEALSIDQLAHELGERLVDAGMSEDGSEAVNVLQDLFQSESKEWDLTHKAEKRVISEAKDIMWEEENGFDTASETGGNGGSGTGADVMFSITPEVDAEYMAAVESGDMEKAGVMVKAAFKARFPNTKVVDENGEPLVVYHGMRTTGDFNKFKGVSFFTDNADIAEMFHSEYEYVIEVDGVEYPTDRDSAIGFAESLSNGDYGIDDVVGWGNIDLDEDFRSGVINGINDGSIQIGIDEEVVANAKNIRIKKADSKIIPVFLNITNPNVKDFEGRTWTNDNEIIDGVDKNINDGVIVNNIVEGGLGAELPNGNEVPVSTDYVTFSPNQIKSAEAVTYDDEGNVVPLSERFNEGNDDVRFAIGGDVADHGGDAPWHRGDAPWHRGDAPWHVSTEREDVIEGMSDAKLRIEEVKKREPVYRDRGHAGESVVQFMQRWQAWREEMVAATKESEAADRAYKEMYGESVPEIPKFQTGMTLGEYMQLYTQYANNIDGAKLVADWNREMRPIRRAWSFMERQLYEKNVSLRNWMDKLKEVAKENGLDFEIDEETNVLEAIRQVSSRVEPRVRGFVMNEMKAVAKAIAAISADAENEYGNWRIAKTRDFWTVQRQRSGWKIGDWEYGIRWRNVDSETTPEAERRDGKELTPLELIGAYLQALDAVEAEQHPEWDIPDRGMWGFLNQLYMIEDGKEVPMTAQGLIEMFEENVGEEKCRALQDAMFNATQFTMNELLRGGLISQEEYNETMRMDANGNAERRHYVPERGWAKEEYMDDTVFTDAMRSASGRTSMSANPIIYTFLLAQSAVNTAERNLMRQKVYNMAMKYKTLGQATGAYRVAKMYFWRAADGMEAQWTETPPSKEAIEHDERIKEEIKEKRRERMKVMAEWRKVEYALRMKDVSEIDIKKKEEEFERSQELAAEADAIDAEIKRLQESLWINPIVHDMNKQKAGYDSEGGRLVKMRVDGVEYSVVLDDTETARAINGMFYREYSDTLHKAASTLYSAMPIDKLTKLLSALKTQYSFTFAAANFVRDVQFAAIMNSVENGEKFAGKALANTMNPYLVGAIKAYLRGGLDKYSEKGPKQRAMAKMMRDFVEGGGITGYSFMQDSKKMRDMFGKILKTEEYKEKGGVRKYLAEVLASPFGKGFEKLEIASQVSELMTRFGQYVTAIESGMSKFDAISQAKHITTNFNIQGNIAGYLGPLFMFTNATLQGGYRIILAGCKSKKARRKLGLMCALYAVGGFLQAFFEPDDPDEERFVPDWLRKTSVMVGGFAVPLPHFFRTMWYAGTCVAQAVRGTKTIPEALHDGLTNMIEDNLPTPMNVLSCFEISKAANTQGEFEVSFNKDMMMRNIMPSIIQPWFDVAYNINFMGSPIYKEAFGGKDADERANKTWLYFHNTDQWLIDGTRWLQRETGGDPDNKKDVRGLDYNPGKIQYIVKAYTGGALVDMWKAMQDVIGCSKALYYWDGSYVPKAEDWVLVNRFYKPYEPDRMQTAYYWDVKNCNDAFIGFYKGLSKEEKEEWKKSKAYKVYEESNGKVGAMNEKIKRGESLSNEEVKELMEWSRRWNLVN